jgi:hypothetical protein
LHQLSCVFQQFTHTLQAYEKHAENNHKFNPPDRMGENHFIHLVHAVGSHEKIPAERHHDSTPDNQEHAIDHVQNLFSSFGESHGNEINPDVSLVDERVSADQDKVASKEPLGISVHPHGGAVEKVPCDNFIGEHDDSGIDDPGHTFARIQADRLNQADEFFHIALTAAIGLGMEVARRPST